MSDRFLHLPKGGDKRDHACSVIRSLSPDQKWKITIAEDRTRRSEQQNRYLWGVVYAEVMKHLEGWDAEDVHNYFLGEHFGWEQIEGMGRTRIKPIRRSSRLNKQEFADYLAFIVRKSSEFGIVIPDPDPEWFMKDEAA